MTPEQGGGPPDMHGIRAARTNVRYHLRYIGYLIATRNWLAGDQLTYADLAAAAHLSAADYLGDVPWDENETARNWYARVKSRPSFRALLPTGFPAWRRRPITRIWISERARPSRTPWWRGHGRSASTLVRVTTPDAMPLASERLRAWLAQGHHGSMEWMAETAERRADPQALWPEVRSIILLGLNYGPDGDPLAALAWKDRGAISVYARNRDYHDVIKGKLKEAAGLLAARGGSDVKVFVDTAPVMEKPLAEAAGLGWQGKHTVLVSREFGNWLFLGAIFTTAELPADAPEQDHCGSCRALPRHLPDERVSRALPARCAPLHLLSDDRAQGPHPGGIAPRHRQPDLRLRRLPGRLSLEQVRPGGPRGCG